MMGDVSLFGLAQNPQPPTRAEPNALADIGLRPAPIVPGNIDLNARPVVANPDGSYSTVRSISVDSNGRTVLLPTVSDDGRIMSGQEAIQHYLKTGRHLGIFDSPASADAFGEQLHEEQARRYTPEMALPTTVVPDRPTAGTPYVAPPTAGRLPYGRR